VIKDKRISEVYSNLYTPQNLPRQISPFSPWAIRSG
jgi:hypothetical protein